MSNILTVTVITINFVSIVETGGQTAPYWLGIFPIGCNLRYGWLLITVCFQGLLSFACLFLQIRIYIFVRTCIRYSPPDKSQSMELVNQQPSNSSSMSCDHHDYSQCNTDHMSNKAKNRLNKLEIRAARILGFGIFPFCLVTLTLCISTVLLAFFRYKGLDVFWVKLIMEIFRDILIVHLIYIPAIFIAHSREFRAAGKRFCRNRRATSEDQFV